MDLDDLGDIAIVAVVLYLLIGLFLTYPCLVAGYYFDKYFDLDVGFYVWLLSVGVLVILFWLRQIWLIIIIYLVTLVPFIFICLGWWKELYGG